ncbi:DUF1604-domain-containing protein [Cryphonectria parasitica EP155]|uniref:DUF1604-domain-containing protein n=1 Tax=Cryphonectria parasitica (strain ATCC 38755 / EP155) TaxID=660469 RepID=A0A9P4XUL5_CRYP1|nr:DUF1604-domain-containing protein [Cryphonectria parasitica EP155]KAF3761278.1 DUF1604-domain-containing protein [Cryphonectria parasitica EP155]
MSSKRSRATYEADLKAQQSPFVVYGTPLPAFDPDARDDGSYVPIWKQEVTDDRGRKRLHGAFTGGWSAGYFNTVGSKEGWTPSTFVSSRANRRKDNKSAQDQRPEDFMDDEDLAEAEESRKLQTSNAFASLGATEKDAGRVGALAGLFHVRGETMGTKLLKKMGWRVGQGIGPKVRRGANLDMKETHPDANKTYYFFAPENVLMVSFVRKTDRKGLGYDGEGRLAPLGGSRSRQPSPSDDEDEDGGSLTLARPKFLGSGASKKKNTGGARGSIGIGVLNDTGSDDEDPYEIGPRISYNRVIGGSSKGKKKRSDVVPSTTVNPTLKSKPVFLPKRAVAGGQSGAGLRKCHDGRPPLEGFVLGQAPDPLISMINSDGRYPPPEIPEGWTSGKKAETTAQPSQYTSTADAAKASQLNPTARAALLGEKQLPGKSVFDFLSTAARDRLAAVTGKGDLPQAKGEIPEGYALSEEEKKRSLLERIPKLDKPSALAAMARGAAGGGPYGDNEDKRARYRGYLELQAGLTSEPPERAPKMTGEEWIQELNEFYNVARIFRPMTGTMASRFTTSKSSPTSDMARGSDGQVGDAGLLSKPVAKPEDPAEAAAKMNMFGPMTRSVGDFFPTRLLCKRFNVKPPSHVQRDGDVNTKGAQRGEIAPIEPQASMYSDSSSSREPLPAPSAQKQGEAAVDSGRNEALEGKRAGDEVFKAIFGDSSDEEG